MKVGRKKGMDKILIPIASMGDIAFLLIIFFMLASNFIKEAHVDLKEATSPDIDSLEEVKVSVSVDKEGQTWLQGKPCPVDALEGGVSVLLKESEKKTVMLKVDRELKQEVYGPVLMALSKAGAEIALIGIKGDD